MTMFDALTRGMNCDEAMAAILKGMCDAVANEVGKTEEKPVEPEKEKTPTEKPVEEKKTNLITVAYTENDEDSDAHVIFPTDVSDAKALADVTYALAYAIGDVISKGLNADRGAVANEILKGITKALISDTLNSLLK